MDSYRLPPVRHAHEEHESDWREQVRVVLGIIFAFFWVVWACQLSADCPNYEEVLKKRATATAAHAFAVEVRRHADSLGRNYGPKECFSDLRRIALYDEAHDFPAFENGNLASGMIRKYLRELCEENVRHHLEWRQEYKDRAFEFSQWAPNHSPDGAPARAMAQAWHKSGLMGKVRWSATAYLRSMLLALLLFLFRAWRRRGITTTILASKRGFALAVLGWPVGLFTYPYNIVREIRVEAELRRWGDALRRLNPAERDLVRAMASSAYYREWLTSLRRSQERKSNRSLLAALLAVLVVHLFVGFISIARAEASSQHETVGVTATTRDGPTITQAGGEDKSLGMDLVLPTMFTSPPLIVLSEPVVYPPRQRPRRRAERIRHVPNQPGYLQLATVW